MSVRLDKGYEPLPGYRLIERLGRGGFGEVWKVEAPGQLYKAMKFVFGNLDSHDDDGRPAEQELKALNRVKAIRHPYILSLERIDIIDGQLLIVMELADRNLWDRFRECRQQKKTGIPRDELLTYLSEAAEALDVMNDNYHIQHLDVKPQNLFLLYHHVKVADFGLAKAFEGGRGTITGGVTPVYAAPETFEGYASRYTDQYSLAICFQELLTGTRPFNGSNTKQLLMQHLNGVPDLSALPTNDKPIIAKALNKKPDDRWPNCVSMIQALKASLLTDTPVPTGSIKTNESVTSTPIPRSEQTVGLPTKSDFNEVQRTKVGTAEFAFGRPANHGGTKPALKLVTAREAAAAAAGRPVTALPVPVPMRSTAPKSTLAAKVVPPPPEMTSTGSLVPAIIVGVGQHGRLMIQQFQSLLRADFGSLEAVPHLQFLYIDTDGEEIAEATKPDSENAIADSDVIHARLNRSTHYLQRDGLPSVETWMPHGQLYRLPREPKQTSGIRAYGRLALLDHARVIRQKIRTMLSELADETRLQKAATETGRGIRTNRPRIYVIASTTGGTGSGMTIDLAYLLKNELRKFGYTKPYVAGVLFVPAADKTKPKNVAMANSFAFLEELKHFSTAGTVFHTRFDNAEPPVSEGEAPFAVTRLVQLPDTVNSNRLGLVVGSAARQLALELLTPIGRVADEVRDEALAIPRPEGGPVVQAGSHFRYTWPRKTLLESIRCRFGSQLLQRWAGKEATHLREPIRLWLSTEWTKRELELENVVDKLTDAVTETLRETPAKVFDAFVEPLRISFQNGGKFNESAVCDVFEEMVKIVGGPNFETDSQGKLDDTLRQRAKLLTLDTQGILSALTVSFIEQPQYRLAGAEEALAQISDKLNLTIESLENIRKQIIRELAEVYQKLYSVIRQLANDETGLFGGRKTGLLSDLCELLRRYPNSRLKLGVLETALSFYRSLQGQCPEFTREIGNCRNRLMDMADTILKLEPTATYDEPLMPILPPGCESISAAADEFIGALPVNDLLTFETELQHLVVRKLRGIVNVTVKSELREDFLSLFERKSREFIEPRVETTNPAELFFRYKADQPDTPLELSEAFDLAAPELTSISGAAPAETTILALPSDETGEKLKAFFTQNLEGVSFIYAPIETDIVICREYPLLEITSLPQMASHAFDAYAMRIEGDHPPHSRYDIAWKAVDPR